MSLKAHRTQVVTVDQSVDEAHQSPRSAARRASSSAASRATSGVYSAATSLGGSLFIETMKIRLRDLRCLCGAGQRGASVYCKMVEKSRVKKIRYSSAITSGKGDTNLFTDNDEEGSDEFTYSNSDGCATCPPSKREARGGAAVRGPRGNLVASFLHSALPCGAAPPLVTCSVRLCVCQRVPCRGAPSPPPPRRLSPEAILMVRRSYCLCEHSLASFFLLSLSRATRAVA